MREFTSLKFAKALESCLARVLKRVDRTILAPFADRLRPMRASKELAMDFPLTDASRSALQPFRAFWSTM